MSEFLLSRRHFFALAAGAAAAGAVLPIGLQSTRIVEFVTTDFGRQDTTAWFIGRYIDNQVIEIVESGHRETSPEREPFEDRLRALYDAKNQVPECEHVFDTREV